MIIAPLLSTASATVQKTVVSEDARPEIASAKQPDPTKPQTVSQPIAKEKSRSRFSIEATLQRSDSKDENEETTEKVELPSNHFTETDLHDSWQNYLEELKEKDVIIYNAIHSFQLKKQDENTVEIIYPSSSAKSEFEKIREEFFGRFMRKVNHFNIQLEYRKDVSMKREIVTKRMIFDKFAAINPVLRELDDLLKFDLN
ncbi:hypothetical protein [Chryseobacterium sp. R2A-55]|uniref:hypothetical protein n=1 Tax=Chryseobacterium sp. R2A-55 TaxID=2744445 RepID=UPI001F24541E|nr:hypothetical protein [Chryseobacterium sp. R2A-55]